MSKSEIPDSFLLYSNLQTLTGGDEEGKKKKEKTTPKHVHACVTGDENNSGLFVLIFFSPDSFFFLWEPG